MSNSELKFKVGQAVWVHWGNLSGKNGCLYEIIAAYSSREPHFYIVKSSGLYRYVLEEKEMQLPTGFHAYLPVSGRTRAPAQPAQSTSNLCSHEWKQYIGLGTNKPYNYCVKCDEKDLT